MANNYRVIPTRAMHSDRAGAGGMTVVPHMDKHEWNPNGYANLIDPNTASSDFELNRINYYNETMGGIIRDFHIHSLSFPSGPIKPNDLAEMNYYQAMAKSAAARGDGRGVERATRGLRSLNPKFEHLRRSGTTPPPAPPQWYSAGEGSDAGEEGAGCARVVVVGLLLLMAGVGVFFILGGLAKYFVGF